nr:hypothetical protein BaRGS_009331 [Batillaria attramentaria]
MHKASVQFSEASEAGGNLPKLMLFSFDGFGWNYLQKLPKSSIPNFHKFIDSGVHVRWIENVFPTPDEISHQHGPDSEEVATAIRTYDKTLEYLLNQIEEKEGSHGWDPRYSINMYPFFIATGPAFKKGVRDAAPFRMVDIYPMMCHILGLEPAPNNGTLDNVRHILATDERSRSLTSYVGGVVAVVVILWKIRQGRNVSASYKRTFAKAGTWEDQRMQDGMVVLSDEEL